MPTIEAISLSMTLRLAVSQESDTRRVTKNARKHKAIKFAESSPILVLFWQKVPGHGDDREVFKFPFDPGIRALNEAVRLWRARHASLFDSDYLPRRMFGYRRLTSPTREAAALPVIPKPERIPRIAGAI